MGCDGGTIPKRDELVKTKKKPEQKDKKAERAFRWKHCAITQQPLQKPVVSCELGRLYSKEAVLETLLNKETGTPEVAAHIRNLKDVKELQLTENPAWDKETSSNAEVGDAYIDVQKAEWICPVSSQEMNGTFKFWFIWTCGCVLSDKALKEMRKANADSSECLRCQKPFVFDDAIIINPTEEEEQSRQVEKMNNRRLLAKKKKVSKKRDIEATATSVEPSGSVSKNGVTNIKEESSEGIVAHSSISKGQEKPGGSKLNGNSDIPAKRAKISEAASSAKGGSSSKTKSGDKVPNLSKDPNESEVYKSLFTSHHSAQNQQKAHWVTYNPFYN